MRKSLLLVVIGAVGAGAAAANPLLLRAVKSPGAADGIRLEWTGNIPDFRVFRADRPDAVLDPSSFLVSTPSAAHDDTPPAAVLWSYSVKGACDPDGLYVLDSPIGVHCGSGPFGPFDLQIDAIQISGDGAVVRAVPGPMTLSPENCTGGPMTGFHQHDFALECFQVAGLSARFTDPDTISGDFVLDPAMDFPPGGSCGPTCSPFQRSITARR